MFILIYLIGVCVAQDPTEVPPSPLLQLKTVWRDVFPTEKVEFSCGITDSSEWTFTLLKDGKNLHSFPRDGSMLVVTAGSGGTERYSCVGQHEVTKNSSQTSSPVELTVYDNKPKPTISRNSSVGTMYTGESISFKCELTVSSGWEYLWYHNGKEISSSGDTLIKPSLGQRDDGQYECKAKRGSDPFFSEASEATSLQVSAPPTPTLRLETPWHDVFEKEVVLFTCELSSMDWTSTWYCNNEKLSEDDVLTMDDEDNLLNITSVSRAHQGQYACKAHLPSREVNSGFSNTAELTVYEQIPKASMTKSPEYEPMYVGETVNFTCSVSTSTGWKYVWYKDGKTLSQTSQSISVYLNPSDGGDYYCQGTREKTTATKYSKKRQQNVAEIPVPSLKLLSKWTDVFPTESVTLHCGMQSDSGWTYTWFKDTNRVQADSIVSFDSDGATLSIKSASAANAGAYKCEGHLQGRAVRSKFSSDLNLQVYDNKPKPTISRNSSVGTMYTGESISFKCELTVSSGWEYLWYHNGKEIPSSGDTLIKPSLGQRDDGQYECKAKRGSDPFFSEASEATSLQVSAPPTPTLRLETPWHDVFEKEVVLFTCELSSMDWTSTWYRNNEKLSEDDVLTMDDEDNLLNITSVSRAHQGQYACKAHLPSREVNSGFSNTAELTVYEQIPMASMTKSPEYKSMYVGETVNFTCSVSTSTGWKYVWYKDGKTLSQTSQSISVYLNPSDGGNYYCQGTREKTTATKYSKKRQQNVAEIPVPSLKLLSKWTDVFPTESVTLHCGMQSGSGWTYTWFKDTKRVQADSIVSFDSDGATLSIKSASAANAGAYKCEGHLQGRAVRSKFSSDLNLQVYDTGPRVLLLQKPPHSLMHTGDSVSFSCHVNVSSGWQYLWFKDNKVLTSGGNNHTIGSVVTASSGSYQCQVKRGMNVDYYSALSRGMKLDVKERPQAAITLFTGWSEVFSTDSLVLGCNVDDSHEWNYTWFKENKPIYSPPSEKHKVTPQNNLDQSEYTCQGERNGRPAYSKHSTPFKTKNLLLKRRLLLSISGVIFFGIIVVFLGCIAFRVLRKPDKDDERPDDSMFPMMPQLKDFTDNSCPLAEFITEAALNAPARAAEVEENGIICSETTQLPITSPEDRDVMNDSNDQTENNGGLTSFQH